MSMQSSRSWRGGMFWTGWIVAATCAVLAGCAEKFVLSGSPEVAGLLIVEPEVSTKSFMGTESKPPVLKVVVRKVVGDIELEGEPLGDTFVFQALKPGKYQLISVSTQPGKKEVVLSVPGEDEEKFTFEVAPGEPTYLGVVAIQQDMRLKELGMHFKLVADIERERAAWNLLLKQLTRSQWKPVIESHIDALR